MPPPSEAYQAVQSLAWSADGARLAVGAKDGTVRVWAAADGALELTLVAQAEGRRAGVNGLAFRADGSLLAVQADGTLRSFAADGRLAATWHGHDGPLQAIALSPGAGWAFTAGRDGTVRRWDLPRLAPERTAWRPGNDSYEIAWRPDGQRAAITGWSGFVEIRDVTSGKVVRSWTGHEQSGVGVAWSRDGRLVFWQVAERRQLGSVGLGERATVFDFAPAGGAYAMGWGDGEIATFHPRESGASNARFAGHEGAVNALRYSPDGSRIATASADGTARIWDAASGELLLALPFEAEVFSLAWSPDGATLAVVPLDGSVRILESAR